MSEPAHSPMPRTPPARGASAGVMLLAVNVLCTGAAAGIGALVGALVPLAAVGFFIGFFAGIAVVSRRFRDL